MDIAANIAKIKNELPENVCLVAVSKTKPNKDILQAYHSGHKIFGENERIRNQYYPIMRDYFRSME